MGGLELLIVIFVLLWAVGAFAFPIAGSAVHVLLVVVLVLVVIRILNGRQVF